MFNCVFGYGSVNEVLPIKEWFKESSSMGFRLCLLAKASGFGKLLNSLSGFFFKLGGLFSIFRLSIVKELTEDSNVISLMALSFIGCSVGYSGIDSESVGSSNSLVEFGAHVLGLFLILGISKWKGSIVDIFSLIRIIL